MKKYIFLILTIGYIALVSCDGQDRIGKTNTEILESNKLLDSFSDKIEYIPETYTERTIDTLFSNGVTAKMTFYSDMNNAVYTEEIVDSITKKTFIRAFVIDVEINSKENKSIFKKKLDKSYLVKEGAFTNEEAKLFIMNDFSILNYKHVHNGCPILTLHYVHIKSKEIKILKFYFLEDKSFFEIIT